MSLAAFRKAYTASDKVHEVDYSSTEARQLRYVIYWAWYENAAYSRVHSWSQSYRHTYALYKYIRNLYNPAYRLGDFYTSHLFGGALDLTAGETGAIPIQTENENLRPAIAELWKYSNMSVLKDVIALRGAIEGDVFLRVVDAPEKNRVYLSRLAPGLITECEFDAWGNVKGYTLEEERSVSKAGTAKYKLIVSRDGDFVVYETFKGNSPFGWDNQPSTWAEPYTFVPLVLIKHHDVGLEWGWSELHPMRSKVHEADELASMLSDFVRKHLNPSWLGKCIAKQTLTLSGADANTTGETDTRPQPGREELRILYGAKETAALEPIIAKLDLANSLKHLEGLLAEIERDYPELQTDIWSVGATSGRALRVARQRVESKALQRREGYDSGLVRAQKMALTIGGFRRYPGYERFDLSSFAAGDLEHTIAPRPVFSLDSIDIAEIRGAEWAAIKAAVDTGAPLEGVLRSQGWSSERIVDLMGGQDVETVGE